MSREEFLAGLEEALAGEVPASVIRENLNYYNSYISQEMAKELAQAVAEVNPSVEAAASIREAVHKSLQRAGKDDVVVIFGSLSYLCEAEQAVESYQEEKAARQE